LPGKKRDRRAPSPPPTAPSRSPAIGQGGYDRVHGRSVLANHKTSLSAPNRPATPCARRLWQIALLLLLAMAPVVGASDAGNEIVVLREFAGQGEQCLVCRVAVHGEPIAEVRFKGRTFHVRLDMLSDFRKQPEFYFASLEARSGLFDEGSVAADPRGGSYGWFGFGLYMLTGLVFGAACGAIAVGRSRAPWPWFFAGLVVNVFALAALLTRGPGEPASHIDGIPPGLRKVPTTRDPIACPACRSQLHPAARLCSQCGAELSPRVRAETAEV